MKLPNHEQAIIAEAKLTDYLLSPAHPTGRGKAGFFIRFGFTRDAWETLEASLRQHAADHEVAKTDVTPFGIRYIIEGKMQTPDGREPDLRSIWFIETGSEIPHFVTAYPLKPKEDQDHE